MLANVSVTSVDGLSNELRMTFRCFGEFVPSRQWGPTFCPPIQAPPKKALLSREQFGSGKLGDREGQVPMY